jgi:para-aminobenzoate synthetase component 1
MRPLFAKISSMHTPEALVSRMSGEQGVVLLRTGQFDSAEARYSFLTARPFATFRSIGSRCETLRSGGQQIQFGNPWSLLDRMMERFQLFDEPDLPFPLGGCFGYWGYDLKNFVEPKLSRRALNDLDLPDCCVGFYDSLVVFDHLLNKTWIVSTGLEADGSRSEQRARAQMEFWRSCLKEDSSSSATAAEDFPFPFPADAGRDGNREASTSSTVSSLTSTLTRGEFISRVERALAYIRAGDIYQVNLSHRLQAPFPGSGLDLFQRLGAISPAPYSAYLDLGDFQIASSSPELFLRLTGGQIRTRPIKGTRPRSPDPTRDAQLTYELQSSSKELAELVMITDLLRNDLGKVCEFGSVLVPELVRLERYAHVQHLVSTVEGRLRPNVTHFEAFASCFPGGSVTGAPKFRAMEIIDELEPNLRGPYTGALGYLGFNRESQLSIIIRAAICKNGNAYFHTGAGIVAESDPAAEYDETLAKAAGFLESLRLQPPPIGVEVPDIRRARSGD